MLRGTAPLTKEEMTSLIGLLPDGVLKERLVIALDTPSSEVIFQLNEEDIETILDLEIGDSLRTKLNTILSDWRS